MPCAFYRACLEPDAAGNSETTLCEKGEGGNPHTKCVLCMKAVERVVKIHRVYRTRKLGRNAFPGFHPGLFSCLPYGKSAVVAPFRAADGTTYGNKNCSCDCPGALRLALTFRRESLKRVDSDKGSKSGFTERQPPGSRKFIFCEPGGHVFFVPLLLHRYHDWLVQLDLSFQLGIGG